MAKFGDLIDSNIPVLIDFYTELSGSTRTNLKSVASALRDKAKVIKIDVDKNRELANALKVTEVPTYMIYKNGKLEWKQNGNQDEEALIAIVQQHL